MDLETQTCHMMGLISEDLQKRDLQGCAVGITVEPTHEIMALVALSELNLQTRMRSNSLWLHV